MRASRPLLAAAAATLVLAGCGGDDESGSAASSASEGPRVLATTTQVADLARNVAGDRASVTGLLQPNSDPHDYEPRPSDVQAAAEADVVLRSGGEVDAWTAEVVDDAGGDVQPVSLIDAVRTIEGHHEHEEEGEHAGEEEAHAEEQHAAGEEAVDPHWWQDPRNAERAVTRIRDVLTRADPGGRATYEANAARYVEALRALDAGIAACLAAVPAERRKLVTNHDALGYFAERYDVEVVGAVLPGLSTQAESSAADVAALARTVRDEDVRTIFPENALNPSLEQALARDTGARVGPPLYADALGARGSEGATYLDALRFNANAMAEGFGGRRCTLPEA